MDWKLTLLFCQLQERATGRAVLVTYHRGSYRIDGGEGVSKEALESRVRALEDKHGSKSTQLKVA